MRPAAASSYLACCLVLAAGPVARAARTTFENWQEAETASPPGNPMFQDRYKNYGRATDGEFTAAPLTCATGPDGDDCSESDTCTCGYEGKLVWVNQSGKTCYQCKAWDHVSSCPIRKGTCAVGECHCRHLPDTYALVRRQTWEDQTECWACRAPTFLWHKSVHEYSKPCAEFSETTITKAAEYCFTVSFLHRHCVVVVSLSDGTSAMFEVGSDDEFYAAAACHVLPSQERMLIKGELNTIMEYSVMKGPYQSYTTEEFKDPFVNHERKSSAGCIGEYKDKGYSETPCYPMTMRGLHDWTWSYLKTFRKYTSAIEDVHSSLKYATGVYNAVTRSHFRESLRWRHRVIGGLESMLSSELHHYTRVQNASAVALTH